MVDIETGGPAFPVPANEPIHPGTTGMMLRDYFAARAMQAMCEEVSRYDQFNSCAKDAYKLADAMMEARK
jgi:hypothetical protein